MPWEVVSSVAGIVSRSPEGPQRGTVMEAATRRSSRMPDQRLAVRQDGLAIQQVASALYRGVQGALHVSRRR
jgi:hypothetical protein